VLDEMRRAGVRTGLLLALPTEVAERILAGAIRISVPAGATVQSPEEHPRIVVVLSGLLRVFLRSVDGRQVTVRYARAGDVTGLSLVVGGPPPTSIQAMTSASVASVSVEALRSMLATEPAVARACLEELSRQLHLALDDLSEQAFLTVRQRIARHLLDLGERGAGRHLVACVSQQELADAVGSVREVVARSLHRLRDEGLIETARDEIVLLDPAGLSEEISGSGRSPAR
jgi:CRP/FNR family transcriptional regulator